MAGTPTAGAAAESGLSHVRIVASPMVASDNKRRGVLATQSGKSGSKTPEHRIAARLVPIVDGVMQDSPALPLIESKFHAVTNAFDIYGLFDVRMIGQSRDDLFNC